MPICHANRVTASGQKDTMRNYRNSPHQERVETFYKNLQGRQTVSSVLKRQKQFFLFDKKMSVWEASLYLGAVKDESDPDTDHVQSVHAYQTALSMEENFLQGPFSSKLKDIAIRELFSDSQWQRLPAKVRDRYESFRSVDRLFSHIESWDWLPLVGFIHDLGKILAMADFWPDGKKIPQYEIVGDTFPLGAAFSSRNIFYQKGFYKHNPDFGHSVYSTKTGIYKEHCGLDNVLFTFGHDEYFAEVLHQAVLERAKKHPSLPRLPSEAIHMIRFHSAYVWHTPRMTSGREDTGYDFLADDKDYDQLVLLKMLQKSDLYSKGLKVPDMERHSLRYRGLVEKYIGKEEISWRYVPHGRFSGIMAQDVQKVEEELCSLRG